MARPKGTGREYQVARKLVEQSLFLEEKVSEAVLEAFQVWYDIMSDDSVGASVRGAMAKNIIEMYGRFYNSRTGGKAITLDEFKAFDTKSKTDTGGRPLLTLKYGGD